jgi:peroxiredoxin
MTLPYLERLAQQAAARVFGISQDSAGVSREFREQFELTMPVLTDEVERGYPVSNAFGLTHVPSLFLVDRDSLIIWSSNGFHKGELQELGAMFNAQLFYREDRVPEWKPG